MICENCNINHDGEYGSGRFCSQKCSKSFSTKSQRKNINKKVSSSLKGRKLSESHVDKLKGLWKNPTFRSHTRRRPTNISELLTNDSFFTPKYVKERILKEGIKKYNCEICGIDSYMSKTITLQLHHINGINSDNRIENLQILCPNCHSQTENYAGKKSKKHSIASTE